MPPQKDSIFSKAGVHMDPGFCLVDSLLFAEKGVPGQFWP